MVSAEPEGFIMHPMLLSDTWIIASPTPMTSAPSFTSPLGAAPPLYVSVITHYTGHLKQPHLPAPHLSNTAVVHLSLEPEHLGASFLLIQSVLDWSFQLLNLAQIMAPFL